MTPFWILLRALHFMSVMLLAGSAFYTVLLAPERYRPVLAHRLSGMMVCCVWIAFVSALAMLATQIVLLSDDWRNLADKGVWQALLSTHFGAVWQWEILFACFASVSLLLRGQWRQRLWLVCALLQLSCMALVGHAAMHGGREGALHHINHALHLFAASFWTGGLLPLLFVMRMARQSDLRGDAIRTMMRFSRYGHLAVALTILSGLINSLLISGWPLNWQSSIYRDLLVVKVVLVAWMTAIAVFNRYVLVPRFQLAGERAQQQFIRMTQLELLLSCAVVGLVSVFATLSPA